jgi:uncharacterized protein (UPF0333 family)
MKITYPHKLPKSKKEIAQTMVEFALVFPVVLLITYGIIEFGRMMFIYSVVTSAAREGARYGAAAGNVNSTTKYYMDCAGIRTAIRRTAVLTSITDSEIIVWKDGGPPTPAVKSNRCPPGVNRFATDDAKLGDRIGVHLAVPYSPIIRFLGFGGFTITSENARTILTDLHIEPGAYP